jgi:hypothetical protein
VLTEIRKEHLNKVKKGKVHPYTGTEALYRLYRLIGGVDV